MYLLNHKNQNIPYFIAKSRRKTIGIYIKPDKTIEVRIPLKSSVKEAQAFVKTKADWVLKHYVKPETIGLSALYTQHYAYGDTLWFLGKPYHITFDESAEDNVYIKDQNLFVGVARQDLQTTIMLWLRDRALDILTDSLARMQKTALKKSIKYMGVFTLKSLKSQWGSCSSQGKISLNMRLVHLNKETIDYVVLHELCHLKEQNHGPNFHKLMDVLMPDWPERRKGLVLSP